MSENNSNTNNSEKVSDDERKLFAGGLPQEATEADLKEYFGKFGEVASVTLKMDQMTGRSRGFAFVVFESIETLESVLAQEHVIKGKKVACKKAASKQGKIYVGKFNGSITEDEIKDHFSQFGNVVEIQRPVDRSKNSEPKNFCFVTFDKEEPAENLLKQGSQTVAGQEVEIKKVTVKQDAMGGGGRGRGGGRGGGGGGGWGAGYDGWGGGYDAGWGYGAPTGGPWGGGYGGGYGAAGWGGWNGGGYGGGKVAGSAGGGSFRGGRGQGGPRGRSAPY